MRIKMFFAAALLAASSLSITSVRQAVSPQQFSSPTLSVSSGSGTACAINRSKALYCWGDNSSGQFLDGTLVSSGTPKMVPGFPSGVQAVAVAPVSGAVCAATKTISCWGGFPNVDYLIESPAPSPQLTIKTPPGSITKIAIADVEPNSGGYAVGCALISSAVRCFRTDQEHSIPVTGLEADVTDVVVGSFSSGYYFCALQYGAVSCWGYLQDWGQFYPQSFNADSKPIFPTLIENLSSGVTSIVGGFHDFHGFSPSAPLARGEVKALRDGTLFTLPSNGSSIEALAIEGASSGVSYVSQISPCFVKDGAALCLTIHSSDFQVLPGLESGVRSIDMLQFGEFDEFDEPSFMFCGLKSQSLWCGTLSYDSPPVPATQVPNFNTGVSNVLSLVGYIGDSNSVGRENTRNGLCVVKQGVLHCWGDNTLGTLGIGGPGYAVVKPTVVTGYSSGVSDVSVSGTAVCVLKQGVVSCWNSHNNSPRPVPGLDSGVSFVQAAKNQDFSCAVKSGALHCWQETDAQYSPQIVAGMNSGVQGVFDTASGFCVLQNGALFCGQKPSELSPVSGAESGVTDAASFRDALYVLRDSRVYVADQSLVAVTPLDPVVTGVTSLSSGVFSSPSQYPGRALCALKSGSLFCTNPDVDTVVFKAQPGMFSAVSMVSGSCALRNGRVVCGGTNHRGFLGTGSIDPIDIYMPSPHARAPFSYVPVGLSSGVTVVSSGDESVTGQDPYYSVCAVKSGALLCWGDNSSGLSSPGTQIEVLTPTRTRLP